MQSWGPACQPYRSNGRILHCCGVSEEKHGSKRIEKMLAVAISPGAFEEEAIAALRKAREFVKQNPSLAHPEPPSPPAITVPIPDHSIEYKVANINPFWMN